MSGINLHAVVRQAINVLHPDEEIALYQSAGMVNQYGEVKTQYLPVQKVTAQIQNMSDAALYYSGMTGMNQTVIRAYLHARESAAVPLGIVRPLGRTGDMFRRADGSWWLITAVTENFSGADWVQVRAVLQETPPDFSASEWYEGE